MIKLHIFFNNILIIRYNFNANNKSYICAILRIKLC